MYIHLITKIALSIICGGLIGLERGYNKRPAGFRTHVLVCVGAMTIMDLSLRVFDYYFLTYNYLIDPTRMGAQVVSGIGFIGAGTIIKHGTNIKGLTTAASLWCVAIIGLCIGTGEYTMGVTISLTLSLVLFVFNKFERFLKNRRNVFEIEVDLLDKNRVMGSINFLLLQSKIKIIDMVIQEYEHNNINLIKEVTDPETQEKFVRLHLMLKVQKKEDINIITKRIEDLKGVINVTKM